MHPSQILAFLAALKENNHRAWMDAHQEDYQQARSAFIEINSFLIQQLGLIDHGIAKLVPQQCIFRLHRDIRFSKDKSPYKTNFGAYFAPGGKHGGYAGYYLHLEPNDRSFIAGGIYQPTTEALKKIRQEIDYQAAGLRTIVTAPDFVTLFGGLQGEKLKRPPKGYDADHPHVEWLKMKSFLVSYPVKDINVTHTKFPTQVLEVFKAIVPFNQFLNTAIHT